MYPKVSVAITTYNRKKYLETVLQHYRGVTKYPNYQLIVADDGSTDGTQEYLKELQNKTIEVDGKQCSYFDHLFLSSSNLGVTNSRNQSVVRYPADYYVLVDDDTMHKEGWLTEAINILENFDFGAVTTQRPLWELLEEPNQLSALDKKLHRKTVNDQDITAMEIQYIGSCMVFSHGIWKKVGPMSHPEKRSGICRYSHRISRIGKKVARTYPPFSESIDMPSHPLSLRFTQYKESYTSKVAPKDMQKVEHYDNGINACKEFNNTHYIDTDGTVRAKE